MGIDPERLLTPLVADRPVLMTAGDCRGVRL